MHVGEEVNESFKRISFGITKIIYNDISESY